MEIIPLTRITREPLACMLLSRAEDVVTVTGAALPPPVAHEPNPVGVPTADAVPDDHTVSADAATTVTAPANVRLAIDVRILCSIPAVDPL